MKVIANFFSYLFHPLFVPIYMLIILFSIPFFGVQRLTDIFKLIIISLLFINTILLPIITFFFLKRQGSIQSFQMKTAVERTIPYFILSALYAVTTTMLFRTKYIDPSVVLVPLSAAASILAIIPINKYFKISAHMTAIGSAIAYLFLLHFYTEANLIMLIIFAILTAGIIASSRLYLKAHNTQEIYSGFFVGLIITFFVGSFYLF